MVYPLWPASLPDRAQQDSYGYSPTDNSVAFQPSVGGAMKRSRSSVETADNQVTFWVDTNQLQNFRQFYNEDIGQGSLKFIMPHQITREPAIFVMTSRYRVAPISHDWWAISFTIQEQPV